MAQRFVQSIMLNVIRAEEHPRRLGDNLMSLWKPAARTDFGEREAMWAAYTEATSMKNSRKQQTPSLLVDDHAVRINECWKKSTESIVELSLACCKANNELNSNSKK